MPETRGSRIRALPTTDPRPVTRLATPRGRPALTSSSIRNTADHGVRDDGLNTTAFPNASAGAILRTGVTTGKFQGQIAATTPTGSAIVWHDTRPARSETYGRPRGSLRPP